MWACIANLAEGAALLRHYLDGLAKQNNLVALDPDTCGAAAPKIKELQEHFSSKNNKARYEYNTVIVSLYGYLERYVEDLIGEYLAVVSEHVSTYAELPEAIRANHLMLSLELIRKADYQRNAGTVRPEHVIANLHGCLNELEKYELNVRAFAQHTANLRHSTVTAMCSRCGIADIGPALRTAEAFRGFLAKENPERDVDTYLAGSDEIVFARLDDLANRRNDVAHGTPPDDILSHDLLRELIDFVETYAKGLALVLYERALPLMVSRAKHLGAAIRVIDHRIVCVNLPTGRVVVGDTLIAKTQDASRPFKGGSIREIQRDHVPLESVDGGPGVQIGVRVDFGAKDNHDFYLLPLTR